MVNPIKIDAGLKEAYLSRAINKQTGCDLEPAWVGQFWNDKNGPNENFAVPVPEIGARASCLIQLVRNVPYREVVKRAVDLRPAARDILEKWQLVWERSFPGFENDPFWDHGNVGESYVGWTVARLTSHFAKGEAGMDVKSRVEHSLSAGGLALKAKFFAEADDFASFAKDDPRDSRLHIIDDADTVLSCATMMPGGVTLVHGNEAFQYIGNHDDGLPLFKHIGKRRQWMGARLNDNPKYWFWKPFSKYMKRRSIFAVNRQTAAAIIADMAWQGESHAFVKGASSKSGTWTVDLTGVRTIEEADSKLTMLSPDDPSIVQEQLPFSHEQRFYVHGGRVITSACSDRNFSRIDCREGKRLDDRVAILKVPSVNHGAYDRGVTSHVVDRKLSAAFARTARSIASELREIGIVNYVIDMGLTERGITAVEINTLHYAGPYCMDHRWQAMAYTKARRYEAERLKARIVKQIAGLTENPEIAESIPIFVGDERCHSALNNIADVVHLGDLHMESRRVEENLAKRALTTAILHHLAIKELQGEV